MLPEVRFYVLAAHSEVQRQTVACKLIEKAYRSGEFCYVLTENEAQAEALDRLLWTFRAGSFVPHQRYKGIAPEYENTVLIGGNAIPERWRKIIINLTDEYPPTAAPTEKIIEVLDGSDARKQAGRLRYRHYKNLGMSIETHTL